MKRLIVILLTIALQVNGMDAPQLASSSEIPAELQLKYSQERDRFRSYKLGDPEAKFLPLLREQLKKSDVDLFSYLEQLHIFANLLLAQHFLLTNAANVSYLTNFMSAVKNEEAQIFKQIGVNVGEEKNTYTFNAPNSAALNEIVTHKSLVLKSKQILTPAELKTVFFWSFDDTLGPIMHLVARQRMLLNLIIPAKNQRNHFVDIIRDQLNPIREFLNKHTETSRKISESPNVSAKKILSPLLQSRAKLNDFIDKNTWSIRFFHKSYNTAQKRFNAYQSKILESTKDSIWDDLVSDFAKTGYLYEYTHEWYEQLYQIIRKEIASTIGQLLKKEPTKTKEIVAFASNFFVNLVPSNILPLQLPPFNNPAKTIILPNLDNEKAEAKKAWDEQQRIKEEERRRNNKIKQTADGSSYVLEYQDTPSSITIHNTKNSTQEIIFKHEYPNEIDKSGKNIFPIKYTDWVKQWFSDPQQAIATQGYTDRASKKFTLEQDRWKPVVLHAFSPLVDDYLKQWGRVTTIKNRRNPGQEDILITIPGKIIYPAGSKPQEEAGVFAYIIDSVNGQWYHRMFTTGSLSELSKNLFEKGYFAPEMTGYYDVFFPALPSRKK